MQKIDYKASDGLDINVVLWKGDFTPKAIIQISHGMAEHIKRYSQFANFLVSKGYYVYGHDHRGHGETAASVSKLGYFADKFGWRLVVDDLHDINCMIKKRHPDVEVIIFGHSMGSFIARTFMYKYPGQVKRFIISGTGDGENFSVIGAKMLAKSICRIKGKKYKSKILDFISNRKFNKEIYDAKGEFEWLSTDHYEVKKYRDDPYCGTLFTCGFYYDLFKGIEHLSMEPNIKKVDKDVDLFIISGEQDPVGDKGNGIVKVVRSYKRNGINNVKYKLYRNMRHEILNEMDRQMVYNDIIDYLEN
ncbi:MAG: alpha/beta fold hydrolase [Acidaminobacteraceae bacterium]